MGLPNLSHQVLEKYSTLLGAFPFPSSTHSLCFPSPPLILSSSSSLWHIIYFSLFWGSSPPLSVTVSTHSFQLSRGLAIHCSSIPLYWIFPFSHISHHSFPQILCSYFDLPPPPWGLLSSIVFLPLHCPSPCLTLHHAGKKRVGDHSLWEPRMELLCLPLPRQAHVFFSTSSARRSASTLQLSNALQSNSLRKEGYKTAAEHQLQCATSAEEVTA